jgi:hypothetical protein
MSVVVATVLTGCGSGDGGDSVYNSILNGLNSEQNVSNNQEDTNNSTNETTDSKDDFPPNPPSEMTNGHDIPSTDNNDSTSNTNSDEIVKENPPPNPPASLLQENEDLPSNIKMISFYSNQFFLGNDEVSISNGSFENVILTNDNPLSTVSFSLENSNNSQFETNLTMRLIPFEENGSLDFKDSVILGLTQLKVEGNNLKGTKESEIKAYVNSGATNKSLKSEVIVNVGNQTSISLTEVFNEIQLDNSKSLSDYLKSGNKYQIIIGFSNINEFEDGTNVKDKILKGLNEGSDFESNIQNLLSKETKGFYGSFEIQ